MLNILVFDIFLYKQYSFSNLSFYWRSIFLHFTSWTGYKIEYLKLLNILWLLKMNPIGSYWFFGDYFNSAIGYIYMVFVSINMKGRSGDMVHWLGNSALVSLCGEPCVLGLSRDAASRGLQKHPSSIAVGRQTTSIHDLFGQQILAFCFGY